MNNDLMQKLMISKEIMNKHNQIPRGQNPTGISESINVQEFTTPNAKYNLPDSLLAEQQISSPKSSETPTTEAIKKSKLPDSIKRLMLENPINPPQKPTSVLSDELIEKASRLMNKPEKVQPKVATPSSSIDMNHISMLVKQAVNEALEQNGLLVESVEKSNDTFSFRVGQHVFEGKITKVKKVK